MGIALLLIAVPALLQARQLPSAAPLQWLVLALYLWFSLTYLWTIEPQVTLEKTRGYFQEMMVVWLVWAFAESSTDLRSLFRAWLGGSWILALLTIANFATPDAMASGQFRFAAAGHDPNDVARFIDLGFPIAALLLDAEKHWVGRVLALGYLPLGFIAMLLTASRGGLVAAVVALAGCALLLSRNHVRWLFAFALGLPLLGIGVAFVVPHETLERFGTIAEQLEHGDLNQRLNIWSAGWNAFRQAPILGHGAGSFVSAASLAPIDTAHNTALSILVEGGLCGFFLAAVIVFVCIQTAVALKGPMRVALLTLLAVWFLSSLVFSVGESRTTWLLIAMIALAGRLGEEDPEAIDSVFTSQTDLRRLRFADSIR
jgi:O-antigen ligase